MNKTEFKKAERLFDIAGNFAHKAGAKLEEPNFEIKLLLHAGIKDLFNISAQAEKCTDIADKLLALGDENVTAEMDMELILATIKAGETVARVFAKVCTKEELESFLPPRAKSKASEEGFKKLNAPILAKLCAK